MANLETTFTTAAKQAKELKKQPSNDVMLELYSLYKQATAGDVTGDRPGMFDMVGRAKYDAWTGRKGMSKSAAMQAYVDLVAKLRKQE